MEEMAGCAPRGSVFLVSFVAILGVATMTACGRSSANHGSGGLETPDEIPAELLATGEPSTTLEGAAVVGRDASAAPGAREATGDEPAGPREESPAVVHARTIVIDTHNDVPLRMTDQPDFDFTKRALDGHTDLIRAREGGLDAQYLAVWVNPRHFQGEKAWERSLVMFDAIHRVEKSSSDIVMATTAAEVRRASKQGKLAFLIGVEGAHALGEFGTPEKGLARLRQWYDRGARYITLTWMNTNALGGSSGDYGRTRGLTKFGRQAVALMNDLGMIVDVSHVSDPTFFEAVEASRLPVLASHSGTRALADHYRNLTDDMLRALAKNGGAACIVYYPGFLDSDWAAARRKARRTGREIEAEPVTLSKVIDHIDHAVKVAGVDHVCLGSDFDGIGKAPVGLEDVSKLPNITSALFDRGYSRADVEKILGGNVLRVMEANEAGARPQDPSDSP